MFLALGEAESRKVKRGDNSMSTLVELAAVLHHCIVVHCSIVCKLLLQLSITQSVHRNTKVACNERE